MLDGKSDRCSGKRIYTMTESNDQNRQMGRHCQSVMCQWLVTYVIRVTIARVKKKKLSILGFPKRSTSNTIPPSRSTNGAGVYVVYTACLSDGRNSPADINGSICTLLPSIDCLFPPINFRWRYFGDRVCTGRMTARTTPAIYIRLNGVPTLPCLTEQRPLSLCSKRRKMW